MVSRGDEANRLLVASCEVAAAYLRNHTVPLEQVTDLILSVHAGFARMNSRETTLPALVEDKPEPTSEARIRTSIGHEALISFEDGRGYRTLKRHLTALGLTPVEYRVKWGLPSDYPMVSPAYSQHRSAIAKAIGLGRLGETNGTASALR